MSVFFEKLMRALYRAARHEHGSPGFTFVELLVVIGVGSVVMAAVAIGLFQMIHGITRNRDQMTALRQVQNTGYWVVSDGTMARIATAGDDPSTQPVELFTLSWIDWSTGNKHTITYTTQNMSGGMKKLLRRQLVTDYLGQTVRWDVTSSVATGIVSVTLSQQTGCWRLDVQARSGRQTEFASYLIEPRANI